MSRTERSQVPRRTRRLLGRGAALAVVGLLAVLAAAYSASGSPSVAGAHAKKTACPFHNGQIRAFATGDLSGIAGDIGPSQIRAVNVWMPYLNSTGGILGCKFVLDIVEEPFGDVQNCLRHYREAIASNKYDFFFGSFNSACMAVVTSLTDKAGKAIIANSAADHQPFFNPLFRPLHFHAAVSTFLEGRGMAVYSKMKGWKKVSTITPNFAYGQDVVKAFDEYFLRIQPGSKILAAQFPPFGEKNFQPYINAVTSPNPDAVVGGLFSTDILTFWKLWIADGIKLPNMTLSGLPNLEAVKEPSQMPAESYGFIRGFWAFSDKTPIGHKVTQLYEAKYGKSSHPVPSAWSYAYVSGIQMAKALIEKTKSLDPQAWVKLVETGNFSFASPYHAGPTWVNPQNHMADGCVDVGKLTFIKSLPVPATYDLSKSIKVCMHDILKADEAVKITKNPTATAAAVAHYYKMATTDK